MENIAIGRIISSHGTKGHFKVRSFSGEIEHFSTLQYVNLVGNGRERVFEVEEIKPLGSDLLIKFKGIDTPEEAKLFSNWEIWVDRSHAAPLKPGEMYVADLCKCKALYRGEIIGEIASIMESGACDLLEIKGESGKSFLVPFVDEWVGKVDLEQGVIEIREGWEFE